MHAGYGLFLEAFRIQRIVQDRCRGMGIGEADVQRVFADA